MARSKDYRYLLLILLPVLIWSGAGSEQRDCVKNCETRRTFNYAGNLGAQCSSSVHTFGVNSICTANENNTTISGIKIVTYGRASSNLPKTILCQGPDPHFHRCVRVSGQHYCHWRYPLLCRQLDITIPATTHPDDQIVNATSRGNPSAEVTWNLTTSDITIPATTHPDDQIVNATSRGNPSAEVNWNLTTSDITISTTTHPDDQIVNATSRGNPSAEVTWNLTTPDVTIPTATRPDDQIVNATSRGNPSAEVTWNLTTPDSRSPVVCPSDTSLFASARRFPTAVVEWRHISCPGNTEGSIQLSCSPPSGSEFELNETIVTCTCTDITESMTSQCSFVITVTVVMYPWLNESLKVKTFYESHTEQAFSLTCFADHVEKFWWEHESFNGTRIVSNTRELNITSVSFGDQGSYFCNVKGKRDNDTSAAQVLALKDYLPFLVVLFTNNSVTNDVTTNVTETLRNEGFEVLEPTKSAERMTKLYIFIKITKETQPNTVRELIMKKLDSARDKSKTWDFEIIRTGFCPGEQITTTDGQLSFPDALVGKSVNSFENSLTSSFAARATRNCDGDYINRAAWGEPSIRNVTSDIEENITRSIENLKTNLETQPVSSSNASYVADVLKNVTESEEIETEHIETVATALSKVVEAQNVSEKVTTSVVLIVENVVQSTLSNKTAVRLQSNTSASLLKTLQQQLDNVRDSGLNFTFTTPNIAVRIHVTKVESLVIYKTVFADDDREGRDRNVTAVLSGDEIESAPRESGVTGHFGDGVDVRVSIQIDSSAVSKIAQPSSGTDTQQLPISFLIHRSPALFRDGNSDGLKVNTLIVSASVPGTVQDLPDESNVITHFHPIQERRCAKISCVYWDEYEGTGEWSRNGCRSTKGERDSSLYTCHCNHLTNFAVLLDVEGDINNRFLDYLSKIGCVVSTWCIIITICTYLGIKKIRSSRPQQIVLHICFALLGLYISFLAGIEQAHLEIGCVIFGALIHFFTLASVSWMSVEATNMYLLFVKVFNANIRHFMIKASLVGWGIPCVIVFISVVLSPDSYSNCKYCFPDSDSMVFYISVLGVVGLLITYNLIIFVLVTHKLTCARTKVSKANLSKQETFRRLQNVVAISMLLGVTWSFGLLSFGELRSTFNFIFCALNSFQGLCIFVLFCVRQKEIRNAWINWLRHSFSRDGHSGTTSSTNAERISQRQLVNEGKTSSNSKSKSKVELSNLKSDSFEALDALPYNLYSEVTGTNYDDVKVTDYACYTDVDPRERNLPPIPEYGPYSKRIESTINQQGSYGTTTETTEYMEIGEGRTLVDDDNGYQPLNEQTTGIEDYADIPCSKTGDGFVDFNNTRTGSRR